MQLARDPPALLRDRQPAARSALATYLKRTAGLRFTPGTLEPATRAHSSRAGDYVDYFDHQALGGASFRIESGWGVADLRAVRRGCNIFGSCAGTWDNQITSVRATGRGTMLFDGYAFARRRGL